MAGHKQGSSHHPEAGPGSLGHHARQQGRIRRRRRWRDSSWSRDMPLHALKKVPLFSITGGRGLL